MKNKSKFGIIAIIAGMLLLSTACDPGGGDSNGGDPPPIEGFVWIRPGTFTRGSNDTVNDGSAASPAHQVTLTRGFYMAKYPVTQAQYQSITGQTPSSFSGANRPVENVNWYEAVEFCNALSIEDGLTLVYTITNREPESGYPITSANVTANWNANGYRLPTEAEWEYACRAGTTSAWSYGDSENGDYMWYSGNADGTTQPVGTKPANPWGLFDMHGNVFEWCWDWYGAYEGGSQNNPRGPDAGTNRVFRGGSYATTTQGARSAYRGIFRTPSDRVSDVGFRVVRSATSH